MIAVEAVRETQKNDPKIMNVVFCYFPDGNQLVY